MIPYGRQSIDDDDVAAVVEVLRSDWLTQGPTVERFEQAVAGKVDARHAVSFSSGTAALHGAMRARLNGEFADLRSVDRQRARIATNARIVGDVARLSRAYPSPPGP